MEKMEESQTTNQNETEDEDNESATIPIWVALFLCLGYICTCAGLFCIWESRWSYFTSFYFIFISLSTIGLGDVIPDHPHMLILMFWLVIIGLSIVSMLLSVIQIKIEEWLYKLLVKMQRKYQQAVENGEVIESDHIFESLLENEPWFMRNMASHLITEKQAAQVEKQAETYERVTREMNTRAVQTEVNPAEFIPVSPETQRSATMFTAAETLQQADTNQMVGQEFETANESAFQTGRQQSRDVDSEWDIPSLPMDSKNSNSSEPERISQVIRDGIEELALLGRDQPTEHHFEDQAIQVDAKFGGSLVDQSQNTSEAERRDKETATPQPPQLKSQLVGHSIEMEDKSLMTSLSLLQPQDKETECDFQTRSVQTMFPDTEDDELHQLNVDASEKRRRFSDSRLVTSFEKMSADGKQVENRSAQYSIEDPKMMESTGVQCVASEDLELIESGAQYSIEDPKIMESKAIQCSNVFKMNETGCQYSTEEPKQFESIGIQCTNEFVEFGVQCSPQMVDEEVSAKKDVSIDIDDESTAGPRGTVYKAKVMRSSSTISLNSFELDQIKPIKEKLDIVLQTEDSYLRIARRLDEYRTIKTQNSLQVYATNPDAAAKQAQPLKQSLSNRESKTQYLLLNTTQPGYQWKRRRSSRTKNRRVSFQSFPDDEHQKGTDDNEDNEEKQSPEASEDVQPSRDDIEEEKSITPPRLSAIPSNILTDRPEIRVDSPARDTDPESVDGKQKSGAKKMKRVVKTRPKSKSETPAKETLEAQVPSRSKPTNPFERSNTDLNQLRIDDSHLVEAHQLGQPIQGRAQLHFATAGVHLRKTSTPVELEVSRPVPGNVAAKVQKMESSSSRVQLASSQYAAFIDRKGSLPLTPTNQYETSSAETSHKSSVSSTSSASKRRSSIFSLIRRDTNDSDK